MTIAGRLQPEADGAPAREKAHIRRPEPNGYRSWHRVVEVPVYLSDSQQQVRVEVQIRTIAMDFWASLEHELHYKLSEEIPDGVAEEMAQCAGIIAETDRRMEAIAVRLNQLPKPGAEDASAR